MDGSSQTKTWDLVSERLSKFSKNELTFRKHFPSKSKIYSLNYNDFKKRIIDESYKGNKVIELPTEKGLQRFKIRESAALAKELSVKYPMIKSYIGQGINDPSLTARFSIGADGLHAVIYTAGAKTFYIDPYTNDFNNYIVYNREDLSKIQSDFECMVDEEVKSMLPETNSSGRNADDEMLRTYRIAIACSGEYAQFHLTNQGVSTTATDVVKKAAVLSAMNTSMTRINGVYERDLGVTMEIVADNDKIIFLNAARDGITDGDAGTMINEVQTICDTEIGTANYDIGHVFSSAGSGLASLGVVCVNGQKARGVTGIASAIGDPYDIDYVSHEIGHQFGATHTQNNSCQRTIATAVEPGSASTIMGYAGICAPNVQDNSDDHFHAVNIDQMWSTIQNSANCAVVTDNGNTAPTSDAGADFSIPKSTPFILRGVGTDADAANTLTYNWEQTDTEVAIMPPAATSTSGPAFRSSPSSVSPNRYMPALPTVIAGSTSSTWEVVPSVARELNFSLTVRDNNAGGGNSARDDMIVSVIDVDPFVVSLPGSAVSWDAGTTQTITWNKGTTDVAPINCQHVNIKLSIDGGLTFPITIISNTPNDGTQDVVIPNNGTTSARIMIEAADNIFYNVNATNFTINGTNFDSQSISVQTLSESCQDQNDGIITINVQDVAYTYQVLVTGDMTNLNQQITDSSISFLNINPGNYEVCVTVQELSITHCFEVEIIESQPISLRVSENQNGRFSFNVDAGTAPFSVFLNNDLLEVFNENDFALEIKGSGKITVKTAKECEGEFKTSIDTVYLKQNPISETIALILPFNLEQSYVDSIIFDMGGKLVFRKSIQKQGNSLLIPFKNFAKGVYILKLSINNSKPIKIIKE
jgi:hypothetical protein